MSSGLMIRLKLLVSASLFVFCWQNIALADNRKIEIAVGEWPPYLSEDLAQGGIVAQIITDVFRETGTSVSFRFLPWARAYQETARGNLEATGVWMHKQEREADFIYSDAVLTEQFVFFYEKSTGFDWQTLKDIEGFRLGGGIKYSYGPSIDAAIKSGKISIERVGDVYLNFKKLLFGRVALFPQEVNVGYADLRKHFLPDEQQRITHHPKAFLHNNSHVLFPRSRTGSRALVGVFNEKLKQYRDDGRYDNMMSAHHLIRSNHL